MTKAEKPTILVLGSDHFGNPNQDMFNTQLDDILSNTRQQEMQHVVECLKKFQPTKIALEQTTKLQQEMNQQYLSYLDGSYQLTADERDQIGYRLAKEMNLHEIHAVDWNEDMEGLPNLEEEGRTEETVFFREAMEKGQRIANEMQEYFNNHTIGEFLLWLNDPNTVRENHELYMTLSLMGSKENPVGAKWTAHYWYYRNLLIYKNIVNMATSNEDRIFVLYGAGHIHLLLQFLQESGRFQVENVRDYLTR
ncbi:DUF5694 domain-containing protein [Ornithinibacillus halotolerans]|uniref:Uncharacterized protein n=1 Tax=Ornithinibacillus halotolerans TaxID=1274357 RepID=A0A916RSA1_9BACI|nr:DUF5694 domain-containing protein [Ornithinibacillus halotolerans]GGA67809.1 hypothetical protein GCM10008025_09580 [Ornithinibacillus halotolerans]